MTLWQKVDGFVFVETL